MYRAFNFTFAFRALGQFSLSSFTAIKGVLHGDLNTETYLFQDINVADLNQ